MSDNYKQKIDDITKYVEHLATKEGLASLLFREIYLLIGLVTFYDIDTRQFNQINNLSNEENRKAIISNIKDLMSLIQTICSVTELEDKNAMERSLRVDDQTTRKGEVNSE